MDVRVKFESHAKAFFKFWVSLKFNLTCPIHFFFFLLSFYNLDKFEVVDAHFGSLIAGRSPTIWAKKS